MTVFCPFVLSPDKIFVLYDIFVLQLFGNVEFTEKWRELGTSQLLVSTDFFSFIYENAFKSFDFTKEHLTLSPFGERHNVGDFKWLHGLRVKSIENLHWLWKIEKL